ncbi:protein-L-isoaspartate(D-aspartate) O-methyltransferase [Thiomicrospira microaerophila]|uniref:protein-L-isoaspartate(D-aspartate) O-methyltransferase n=1 Tax=Thiomicrospira microaerophila TaxID=406020 RepID=UPI00200CB6CB|nr:protein-L-isoaspartate(D-aspartate) O-methyltransferase [Thiomicrospira microaerophila]UQB41309.1 protein-L-isoaspartate(D-aspartate) O-methyltransferase [Thiomicrospira microaerophila]
MAELDLTQKPIYPNSLYEAAQGVGLTSQRSRDRLVSRLLSNKQLDIEVLNAIRVTPRHLFMDEALANRAYEDTSLPIGYGQTISQPGTVALMTSWVKQGSRSLNRVLDVGTGSGYQAAILSLVAKQVYSVERIAPLSLRAQYCLDQLAVRNIRFTLSDGHWGWSTFAPYDAIVCAAAPDSIPEALVEQLAEGGRLVLPVGEKEQLLTGVEKTATGIKTITLGVAVFVPLVKGRLD